MTPDACRILLFSPTGTGRRIGEAIARGLGLPAATHDATHAPLPAGRIPSTAAALFVAPVYGGHIAPAALERMKEVRGQGTPAVVAAVYGNRDIGTAAAELAAFVSERGFVPVAAGAFVGEHSYSTDAVPIAAGRPDAADLEAAELFGAAVARKLTASTAPAPVDASRLRAPRTPLLALLRFIAFVLRYRRAQKRRPVRLLPATDSRCIHCGRCAALCPTGAIVRGEEERTDPAHCIRCCACVKGCPVRARSFATPFAAVLARNFSRRKEPTVLL